MNKINPKGKTKRGIDYPTRATKLANGMAQTITTQKSYSLTALKLSVLGSTDVLAVLVNYMFKRVMVEHPTDKGYFKEVYVLSDKGKLRLKSMRGRELYSQKPNLP